MRPVVRRNDEAATQLEEVLRVHPPFAEAHVTPGRVYLQQGRLTEAMEELRKGVEFRGRDAWMWRNSRTAMP
jgi:Flp pilus assembly protein TadD